MDRKRIAFCTIVSVAWAIVLFFPQTTYLQDTYVFLYKDWQYLIPQPSAVKMLLCLAGIICIVVSDKMLNKPRDMCMCTIKNNNVLLLLMQGMFCAVGMVLVQFNKMNDSLVLISPLFCNSFLCLYCWYRINTVLKNADIRTKRYLLWGQVLFIVFYVFFIVRPFLGNHNLSSSEDSISPETYTPMIFLTILMVLISNMVTVYKKDNKESDSYSESINNRFLLYMFILLSFIYTLSKVIVFCGRREENEVCGIVLLVIFLILRIACIIGCIVFSGRKYHNNKLIRALRYCVLADMFIEIFLMNGYTICVIDASNALVYNICPSVCCMAVFFSGVLVDSSAHVAVGRTCLYCLAFCVFLSNPPIECKERVCVSQALSAFFPVVLGLVILLKNRYGNAVQKEKML